MFNFLRKLIIMTGLLLISNMAFAQTPLTFSPTGQDGAGKAEIYFSFAGQIVRTNPMIYKGQTGSLVYNIQFPTTERFAVVGKDVTNFSLPILIADLDYTVTTSTIMGVTYTNYNVYTGNHSNFMTYNLNMDGNTINVTNGGQGQATGNIPLSISNMPTGSYTKSVSCEDIGEVSSGSTGTVRDASTSNSIDVWVVDLEEQTREINLKPDKVYPVNLRYNPVGFPHKNICYVGISWGGGMQIPGMPAPTSNIYEDATCTVPITGTNGEKL